MTSWLTFLAAILAAAAGGLLLEKLRLPSGMMIGATLAVAACAVLFGEIRLPSWFSLGLQFLTGAYIGCKVTREKLLGCLKRPQVIVFLVLGMLVFNTVSGYLLAKTSQLDLLTAMFACAPGGMSDMMIVAGEMGADPVYVSLIQVMRVMGITCVFPLIYRKIYDRHLYIQRQTAPRTPEVVLAKPKVLAKKAQAGRFLLTLAAAIAGGFCFRALGVVAGGIIGAVSAVILMNVATGRGCFPPGMNTALQGCIGLYIGSEMTRETLFSLGGLLAPTLLIMGIMLASSYLMALLICRFSTLDFMTCLLMCTPGGMQEMAILAGEFDCDMASVIITQTLRVVVVLLVFPGYLSFLVEALTPLL